MFFKKPSFFKKSSIYNVRMVITEEKILSNIDKVLKLINPDAKQQIIKLEDDMYFKDLVESITTYLVNYPNKQEFPFNVYKAAYDLVEYATNQFEENNKKISELIELREENVKQSYLLQDALITVTEKKPGWIDKVQTYEGKFSVDVAEALTTVANSSIKDVKEVEDAKKLIETKIRNLESNLHIEIDLDRIESSSKALSFIGIEIADALKTIPMTEDGDSKKKLENKKGGLLNLFKSKDDENKEETVINNEQNPLDFQNKDLNIDLTNEKKENKAEDNSNENYINLNYENINKELSLNESNELKEMPKMNNFNESLNGFQNIALNFQQPNDLLNEKEPQINMFGFEVVGKNEYINPMENLLEENEDLKYKTYYQGAIEANNNLNAVVQNNPMTYSFDGQSNVSIESQFSNTNQKFFEETRVEVEKSFFEKLMDKIKDTKFIKWCKYILNIQVVLDYPEHPF